MNIDLGRATPIYRKQYNETAAYELNDIVLYEDGNLYWHTSDEMTTGVPPTDETVWTLAFSGSDLLQAMLDCVTAAQLAKDGAETAASRQPYPNAETGTWWIWNVNSGSYMDTGILTSVPGDPGKTPQRGVDYWTDDDVQAICGYIDRQLGVIENGSY